MEKQIRALAVVEPETGTLARRLDFLELIDEFLGCQDIRGITKEVYRQGLLRLFGWLKANGIAQPDRKALLDFKLYLVECGLTPNTINCYLISIRRFFGFLEAERRYPNVAQGLKSMKQPRGLLRDSPTIAQVQDLLGRIHLVSLPHKRNFAMINLMARTGLRTCEVVRANIEDIRMQSGEAILFVQGKGRDSKDEFVVLIEKALRPILEYLTARGKADPGAPLFVSHSDRNPNKRLTTRTIRGISKLCLREIGLNTKRLSAHSFRHFCITTAIRRGAPVEQAQAMARHANVQTTMTYYHNIDRLENAAERYVDF